MNLENFSNKCVELLEDNLIGIYLLSPSEKDKVPGYDGRLITIILKKCNEGTLKKIREIGKNFYKDETGKDTLLCVAVDELEELRAPYQKAWGLIRTRTIKGNAIAELIKMPPKEELAQNLLGEVKRLKLLIKGHIASFGFLSEYFAKGGSYLRINNTLMLATVFYFIRSGEYLMTRDQLRTVGDPDVMLICDLLDKYKSDSATSHDIEESLWASLSLLSRIENELKA